jgi:hypothetical protein
MLFGFLAICSAQLKLTLTFESASPKEVFVASELPSNAPSNTVKATGASLEYTLPAFGGSDRIYVWDTATNNIASKVIKDIAGNNWAPKAADFTLIGKLTVHVEHKGQPVQAAKVVLSTKGKSEERLLDPSGKGDLEFFGYPAGDLHVKVSYNTADKKPGSQEQIFPEPPKRDKPQPVLNVAVSDDVATVAETAPTPGTPNSAQGSLPPQTGQAKPVEAPKDDSSPAGKLVVIILLLAMIGGGAYGFLHVIKNKPEQFEGLLKKLGVQIPTQQDPNAAGAPIPVTPLAPAPPAPKIMLDDADPIPLAAPTAVVTTPLVSSGSEPTLVRETGERVSLNEGEALVGREDGLGVSLAGESTVSRRHASVTRAGKTVVVKDLGSTNGTFVNGTRLQGEATLRPGDQVQFGEVRFRYEG